jgi:hypothetical protein
MAVRTWSGAKCDRPRVTSYGGSTSKPASVLHPQQGQAPSDAAPSTRPGTPDASADLAWYKSPPRWPSKLLPDSIATRLPISLAPMAPASPRPPSIRPYPTGHPNRGPRLHRVRCLRRGVGHHRVTQQADRSSSPLSDSSTTRFSKPRMSSLYGPHAARCAATSRYRRSASSGAAAASSA